MNYYLAVDIGASSGRHILSHVEDGKMILEEIYRFENGMTERDGHKVWDTVKLFGYIIEGLKKCRELGKIPVSMGIDTWAVDYVLLDENGEILGDSYAYRDSRTKGMDEEVYKIIPQSELYARTGIQKQMFNTIYQLMAVKKFGSEDLEKADRLLMIPEYLNYLLTGEKVSEYTNASTTQLVSPITKDWDYDLIDMLGYPRKIFGELKLPGTKVGRFTDNVKAKVGFDCEVILPATHDTASAVIAVPSLDEDNLYISSGTWSLMGTELKEAQTDPWSEKLNFTNEGGIDYRFRYLKNIMGMWMINSARKELAPDMSFPEICELAEKEDISSIVPANDDRFMAPNKMTVEVQNACRESGQQVPEGIAQVAKVIYYSLAQCYAETLREIEEQTGKHFDSIHIVGGGSNADYLNRLTAKACGRKVYTGPSEGTAIGNIAVQLMAAGEIENLHEARKLIFASFDIGEYD
ncbi:MAG: rhamnulokinase [Clostridia bacterium]|nr:rhamnulokinase [Clostridia bacterium]